ncbi:ATP-binding protein [Flavobacterium sasangense]|uniref:ATP-binding protein n=1 Tax=Flavobacterium sasangense TaxID=503361 RepID=UPI00068DA165|nr:ATP-binding protein [Flavobacterium sasangense]
MKAFIKYIGVITNDDKIHHVNFKEGVNVITGRSSTGKSAILEVFDYCFGSSEFIIPDGVITNNTVFYFVVLKLKEIYLILGRSKNKKDCFLASTSDNSFIENISNFNIDYFHSLDKYTLKDFRKELNKYFKIDIDDTDEDLEDRKFRNNNAKKAAPSYRNFTSFMLQHQNLIANKHALFYRFDEKEKKEQVIEQFKIFLSFVDSEYFPLKQRLAELNRELRQLEFTKESTQKYINENKEKLKFLLEEFELITNKRLFKKNIDSILLSPNESLEYLDNFISSKENIISNPLGEII